MIYYCQYHSPRTGGSNPCPAYISLEQGQQRIADPEFPYKSDFVFFAGDFYPDTNKIYHNLEYYLQDRIQKATLQMKNILECIADINDKFVEPDDKLPVAGLTEIYYYRVAGGFLHNAYTVFEKKMPVEKITEKMIYFKEGLRGSVLIIKLICIRPCMAVFYLIHAIPKPSDRFLWTRFTKDTTI